MPNQPCPHVTPAMIAAGFTTCGVCESGKDSTAAQADALAAAHSGLESALSTLAGEAAAAAKACARKRPAPDMDRLRAAIRDVNDAENAVDTAQYDLDTARGADG